METRYRRYLSDNNIIFVEFKTERSKVLSFVVKLICLIHGKGYDVVRFDGGHGIPHKDILGAEGYVEQKKWYTYLSNNQALTMAIDDIEDNYEFYRERLIKWLRTN